MTKISVPVGASVSIAEYSNGGAYLKYSVGERISPDGDLNALITELQYIRDNYQDKFSDMTLVERKGDCGCRHDCYCSPSFHVYGMREPNYHEAKFFAVQKEKAKADEIARDRAELERLQKKLGVDVLT